MTLSIEYIAGLFDGEACLTVVSARKSPRPRIIVALTSEPVLKLLHKTFGGSLRGPYMMKRSTKPVWSWTLREPADIASLLRQILPHMHVKREEAELLLDLANRHVQRSGWLGGFSQAGVSQLTEEERQARYRIAARLAYLHTGRILEPSVYEGDE